MSVLHEPFQIKREGGKKAGLVDYQGRPVSVPAPHNGWLAPDGLHVWTLPGLPPADSARREGNSVWWPANLEGETSHIRVELVPSQGIDLHVHDIAEMLSRRAWRVVGDEQPWPLSGLGWTRWTQLWKQHPWDEQARCRGRKAEPRQLKWPYLRPVIEWQLEQVSDWPAPRQPFRAPPWNELAFDIMDLRLPASGKITSDVEALRTGQANFTTGGDGTERFGWPAGKAWLFQEWADDDGNVRASGTVLVAPDRRQIQSELPRPVLEVAIDDDILVQGGWRPPMMAQFEMPLVGDPGEAPIPGWSAPTGWTPASRTRDLTYLVDGDEVPIAEAVLELVARSELPRLPIVHVRTLVDWSSDLLRYQDAAENLKDLGITAKFSHRPSKGALSYWPAALPIDDRRVTRAAAAFALQTAPAIPAVLSVICDLRDDALELAAVWTGTASKWADAPILVAVDRWPLSIGALLEAAKAKAPALGAPPEDDESTTYKRLQLLTDTPRAQLEELLPVRDTLNKFADLAACLISRFVAATAGTEPWVAGWLEADPLAATDPDMLRKARELLQAPATTLVQVGFAGWGWQPWWALPRGSSVYDPAGGRRFARALRDQIRQKLKAEKLLPNATVRVEGDGYQDPENLHSAGIPVRKSGWAFQALELDLGPCSLVSPGQICTPNVLDWQHAGNRAAWNAVYGADPALPLLPAQGGAIFHPLRNQGHTVKAESDRASPVRAWITSSSLGYILDNMGDSPGKATSSVVELRPMKQGR